MFQRILEKALQESLLPWRHTAGLQQAFVALIVILLGLLVGAMTVPSKTWCAHAFRGALFCWLLPKILDFATNRSQTFGHIIHDQLFALFGWHMLVRAIDITFVSIVSPDAPRWIRPTAQELQRMKQVRKEEAKEMTDEEDLSSQLPKEWDALPYPPPFSLARILYAIDFLSLVRPGTSWLFPWQFRAFDWSLPALKSPISSRFGKTESTAKVAAVHGMLLHVSIIYCYCLFTRSVTEVRSLAQFSLPNQLIVTISLGCVIALASAPIEALAYSSLLRRKIVPISALCPTFNQPYLATGIEDFWGRRWHRQVRRHLTRVGSLFPYGRTRSGNVFWAYVVSGVMHSFILARAHPEPTISKLSSYLPIFFDPGTIMFFGLQGVAMLVERMIIPQIFKRLWLWVSLIGTGRWYIDSMLQKEYAVR